MKKLLLFIVLLLSVTNLQAQSLGIGVKMMQKENRNEM